MSKEMDWEVDEIIILQEDYDLSRLPDSPRCKNLLKLSIQVSGLTEIPPTFFEHMPLLEELDLSTTNIQSLPSSISSLTSLQKLFLRDCSVLMELPSEIGMLTKLKLLDCEGSEIMYIPKEIGELNDLEVLRVSLSLYADHFLKTKRVNDSVKIPRNILSKLNKLKELCITTCPEVEWWEEEVKEIQDDLCHLEYLETLKWYLPTKMVLDQFLQIKREGKKIYENLSNFTLTIGRHPQLTSCLPANLQKKFENFENCLKWINAEGNEKDISMIMERAEALFLSRHWTIVRLSDFDLAKLKYCLLAECNEMETLVEVDELSEDVERIGKVGLESIEYLTVHHMEKFQSIWKGPMGKDSLSRLRILALHTCPKLTTIFTINIAQNLSRLKELTVEDCPNVTSLISNESPNIATGPLFPCLEKIFLLDLPELDSIFRGKIILEKVDSLLVYNCLKLQYLSVTELPNIQKIKGEKEWWNDLKCDKCRWQNVFEQLKEERHLIEQLAEATNSLQHFHDILSRDAKDEKPLDRSSLGVSETKGHTSNFPIGEQEGLSLSQPAAKEKLLDGSALGVSDIKSDKSNFPLEEQEGVSLSRPGFTTSLSLSKPVLYPERPGQPDCQFYMKTGDCKFGALCRFHHPRERGSLGSLSSLESQHQAAGNSKIYGTSRQNETVNEPLSGSYASYHTGSIQSGYYKLLRENVFPERPGQPHCQFYMKTGDCRFGAGCRYHHPRERVIPMPNYVLSPLGLPSRPGEPLCIYYSRHGICKFGPSCRFDHPMGVFTYKFSPTSADSHLLASSPGARPVNVTSKGPITLSERRQMPSRDNSIDPEE